MIQKDIILGNLENIVLNTLNTWHFKVHNVYTLVNSPGWQIRKRKIEDWMLVYERGGKGYYELEGTRFPIEEGRIFFVSHHMYHSAGQEESSPASVYAIRFGLYRNDIDRPVTDEIAPFGFCCKINRFSYYQQLFENLYHYFKRYPEKPGQSFCNALLCQIFNALYLKMSDENSPVNSDRRLQEAKLFIEENILEDMALEKVAGHCGLSAKYFSRLFRQQHHVTYKQHVFMAKMNYAKFLLEETDYPVKRVAELLGYSDQYIFSNQFKKAIGVPPSKIKYRR